MKTLEQIIKTARSITVSPVSHVVKPAPCSLTDLADQKQKRNEDPRFPIVWDDAKNNPSRVGDLFAFTKGQGRNVNDTDGEVEVYRIMDILSPDNRAASWSDNVGHGDRNVLVLGECLCVSKDLAAFRTLLNHKPFGRLGRHSPIQGSKRMKIPDSVMEVQQ